MGDEDAEVAVGDADAVDVTVATVVVGVEVGAALDGSLHPCCLMLYGDPSSPSSQYVVTTPFP